MSGRAKDFKWTDDEAELLLTITHNYKIAKVSENVDWESVKSKYDDILNLMREELPATVDEAKEMCKDYPHTKLDMTKKVLTAKLKAVRSKYREAVDSGRRSGHGRVVLLYYELCERIWGGSPATQQLEVGVETCDLTSELPTSTPSITNSESGAADESPAHEESNADSIENSSSSIQDTVRHRRDYLDGKLAGYKYERMKRKLPVDTQLLSCAKEELAIKKRLVDQMENFETQYSAHISKLSDNMEKLSNTIADGFSLLKHLVVPQQRPYQYHPHSVYNPPPNVFDVNCASYSAPFDSSPSPYHPPSSS